MISRARFVRLYVSFIVQCQICFHIRIAEDRSFQAARLIKVQYPWHEFFYNLTRKSFQNDEEWRFFLLWLHSWLPSYSRFWFMQITWLVTIYIGVTKRCEITKNIECHLRLFLCRTETLSGCYTHHKVPWYVHCDISMGTQWAPRPLNSEGKIRVFFLQEVSFALVVHSVAEFDRAEWFD